MATGTVEGCVGVLVFILGCVWIVFYQSCHNPGEVNTRTTCDEDRSKWVAYAAWPFSAARWMGVLFTSLRASTWTPIRRRMETTSSFPSPAAMCRGVFCAASAVEHSLAPIGWLRRHCTRERHTLTSCTCTWAGEVKFWSPPGYLHVPLRQPGTQHSCPSCPRHPTARGGPP